MTERERLISLIKQAKKHTKNANCDIERNMIFADYLLANGVIVPPCKVGDVVWVVYSPKYPADPADKGKWFMSQDGVQRIIYGAKGISIETWNMGTISAKKIGSELFLTKEEAERALRQRKEDEGK